MPTKFLSHADLATAVRLTPLVAIDLIIRNGRDEVDTGDVHKQHQTVDSKWAAEVTQHSIAKLGARIPPIQSSPVAGGQ